MAILKVVQNVCRVVGVMEPTSLSASLLSSSRTMREMLACANEMAQRIAYDTRDWTTLQKTWEFPGTVILDPNTGLEVLKTAFDLPTDYKRMLLSTNLWLSTSTQQPMTFIVDPDEWLKRRINDGVFGSWGEWTMKGGQVHIFPPMPVGVKAVFNYLDKNCIHLDTSPGGFGDEFMNDGDTFRLDERLLKLGMIFDWKMKKGAPYAEDMSTYHDALNSLQGRDQPAPILSDTYIRRTQQDAHYHW